MNAWAMIGKIKKERDALKAENEELRKQVADLSRRVEQLEVDNDELREEIQ